MLGLDAVSEMDLGHGWESDYLCPINVHSAFSLEFLKLSYSLKDDWIVLPRSRQALASVDQAKSDRMVADRPLHFWLVVR